MNTLNTLTPENTAKYLNKLVSTGKSREFIDERKLAISKFVNWALAKGHITQHGFNQISEVIAKTNIEPSATYKNGYGEDQQEALNVVNTSEPIRPSHLPIRHLGHSYIKYFVPLVILLIVGTYLLTNTNTPMKISDSKSSGKVLSFKGKITDNLGNPVTDKTDVAFKLYSSETSNTPIYQGSCTGMNAVTPQIDGTVDVKLGKDCDMRPIPDDLFIKYPNVYLGITPGSDPEMLPRKQIANVGFSSNSNTLQGLPAGSSLSSIPFINQNGDMLIEAPKASISSVSKSSNFTIYSGDILNLESENDLNIKTKQGGSIHFQTNTSNKERDRLVISENGNIGINGADTSLFALQVGGDVGPNFTNIYNLGSFTNQWGAIYGQRLYQNGNEVCDTSNNCSSISRWSSLTSPNDSVSLDMQNFYTKLTYGNSTSSSNLFSLQDTAYNTGTGTLLNVATAPGSRLNPFTVNASGTPAISVDPAGNVGLGLITPLAKLHVKASGPKGKASVLGFFENLSDNTETDGINKYGISVTSTGNFSGSTGASTNNYGIYINTSTGADNNYDIYAASGAYLSTGGTWTNASSRSLKENFTKIDSTDILNKINQLQLTTWNYKTENSTVKHLGPIAEDFYNLFQLGNSSTSISTIDPAGIALAGIQALDKKVSENLMKEITLSNEGDISITGPSNRYVYNGVLDSNDTNVNNSYKITSKEGTLIQNIRAFGEVATAKVLAGLVAAQDIVVKNSLTTRLLNVQDKITSPVVQTSSISASQEANLAKIKTNQIAAIADNITVDLSTPLPSEAPVENGSKGALAKLIIKGLEGKVVTTFDSAGNIITDGNISAKTATLSGSLNATSASISGELVADTIKSKNLDQINEKLNTSSSSISSISNQVNDVQKLLADIKNTSINNTSVQSYTVPPISPTPIMPNQFEDVTVNNLASLYKATITDSLMIGNLIARSTSLLSLNSDFNISSLNTISFFENAVTIAKDGSLTTKGTLTARSIEIKNDQSESVATIKPDGTANFKGISLEKFLSASPSAVIAAPENLNRNGQYVAAIETQQQAAGNGLIPARSNEVIIYNDNIKDTSLVYLTQTSAASDNNITVVQKEACTQSAQPCRPYFKVASNTAVVTPLTFNWLIIN